MIETILEAPLVAKVCALFILLFVGWFGGQFVPRALGRWRDLNSIIAGLTRLKGSGGDPTSLFARKPDLAHLWSEFRKSLFDPKSFDSATGEYVPETSRRTVPAEQIFNAQVVVDSRVGAEFFRHLPGILTGIGIIGTFAGLMHGLYAFIISDNTQVVRASLSALLHSVAEAFLVSASAIFFAMVITVIEKFFIARLYQKTEEVACLLDSLYKAGAGEEMLEELLHSSKEYVSNSKTLKDALVQDLKGILVSLTESQIQAQQKIIDEQIRAHNQTSEELGRQIGQHITEGLKAALEEPMKAVQQAVQSATGDRTGAVHTLLTEVVQGLNQSLKDLFGDQIAGINTMQQQTISALQTAVARMEQMSSSLETAGTRATDTMAAKLGEALAGMEARQEMMARQMAQIVEEMKATVASSQTETNSRLQETLAGVSATIESLITSLSQSVATSQDTTNEKLQAALNGVTQSVESLISSLSQQVASSQSEVSTKLQDTLVNVSNAVENLVSGLSQSVAASQAQSNDRLQQTVSSVGETVNTLVSDLTQQAASADAEHRERQAQLVAQAEAATAGVKSAVEALTAEMRTLVAGTRSAVDTMRASVDSMRTVTTDAVTRMNSGAETLYVASSEFGKAGAAVSGVLQQATGTTDKLAVAAASVSTAAQAMQGVVTDYRATRDQLAQMLTELTRVVDNARTNASLTSDVLSRIEASTQALNVAQRSAEEFLEGVGDVMTESLTAFQQRLADSMTEVNRGLVDKTAAVTSMLRQTIANLAQAIELVVPNPEA
ncbi:anti-phage ZorAB system protein ZorA [Burkholderia gladioli]|uniref:anti-phage ZorAB system protein ZorA n=1 Tax=Burkholderia gladioli TaxID=28095 RepID=UPI00163E56CF|nr:anti-phage ZorAB system protein ZorA [Burkholderia gladioli]